MTSEERRAMIAGWASDEPAGAGNKEENAVPQQVNQNPEGNGATQLPAESDKEKAKPEIREPPRPQERAPEEEEKHDGGAGGARARSPGHN